MSTSDKKETVKKKAVKKKVVKKKAVTKKAAEKKVSLKITGEERWRMIAIAAYHKAERRHFAPGYELGDWIEAEKEIDKLIRG
jgi:hypothetical protein